MINKGALTGIRVLDLTNHRGEMAGRVLADLGAEVICVEPPGGSRSRDREPKRPNGQSLWWATLALGKKSLVLDLEHTAERDQFRELVITADVLVESFAPGEVLRLGLDYASLSPLNPNLVMASITPFGQDGPRSDEVATDLTLEAIGGLVGMQGDVDRPPIPIGMPQASLHAGVQAAADILIALNARHSTGAGQYLDVSTQSAVVWTLMNATGWPSVVGRNPPGFCDTRHLPRVPPIEGMRSARLLECKDGYATLGLHLPGVGERTLASAMTWLKQSHPDLYKSQFEDTHQDQLEEDEFEDTHQLSQDQFGDIHWTEWMNQVKQGLLSVEVFNRAYDAIAEAFKRCTKAELLQLAVERKLLIAPVLNTADLIQDEQLQTRDFWQEVGGLTFAGPFAKLSRTPLSYRAPAPVLGADQEILDDLTSSGQKAHPRSRARGVDQRAFAGLKVADFAWVGVGPIMSKALADHGATVIHIESSSRMDVLRAIGPFKDAEPGPNRSQFFANFNTNKKSIDLDFTDPVDLKLAQAIAAWSDVLVESFVPGTMAKFGLDYATLSKQRGDLIMLSTCMRGQTGPQSSYSGFGNQGAALSGLFSITGWPDRAPTGPWGAYTDFVAPRFGVAAIAAALLHRQNTGQGQYIDLSQIESGIHFMGPLVPDFCAHDKVLENPGMDTPYACPSGVYAAAGEQSYVAIAVETDEQWQSLAKLCGAHDMANWSVLQRMTDQQRIHTAISEWAVAHQAADIESSCQAQHVPAHRVQWPTDLYNDPQLLHRDFFQELDHAEMGRVFYDGHVTHFSTTPPKLDTAAPLLGQHSDEIRAMFAHS